MLVLDALIRYSALSLLIVLIVLIVRDARHIPAARYAGLLSFTAGALLLGTPHPELMLPKTPHFIVRFLDVPSIAFAWWFGRSLFDDDFHLGWFEWLMMLLIIMPVLMFRLYELELITMMPQWLIYTSAGMSISLMVHLIFITLSGRHDDLVETRRRVRVHFVIGLALLIVLILIGERLYSGTYPLQVNTARAAITLILVVWAVLWMFRLQTEKLLFEAKLSVQNDLNDPNKKEPVESSLFDPRDRNLHQALLVLMEEKEVYTEAGLSIRQLAERLDTPEHRLRALINQGMGYRNFSAFVNNYRIKAVKEAMNLPENSRIPILTLAMNVGFNSLAPFNRAFSMLCGETPSEYRAGLHK